MINVQELIKNLKFENGYGSFNDDYSCYFIHENNKKMVPLAWSNIITNNNFGSVITEGEGGFTWYKNSKTNLITKFSNDAFIDNSNEKFDFFITDKEEKEVENQNENNDFYVCFGFGYTIFFKEISGVKIEIEQFIPLNENAKVSIIRLRNNNNFNVNVKIKYLINFLIGENESKSIIKEYFKENLNVIEIRNFMNNKCISYVSSSEKINSNKEAILDLYKDEEKEIVFILGADEIKEDDENIIKTISIIKNSYNESLSSVKKYWKETVTRIKSHTKLASFDAMQNGWLVYQTLVSRLIARTGFYQQSGGYGYRDQLQDAINMRWIDSDILRKQILFNSKHQFEEGDVLHWFHEDSKLGIRSRYSDDMLFLPYAVLEYIDFTGDYGILKEKTPYLNAPVLKNDEKDRVNYYYLDEENSKNFSIFNHMIRAINIAVTKLGKHNIPLMKSGDWNDGMNKIGEKNVGESVWLGFFVSNILKRFIDLIGYLDKNTNNNITSKEISIDNNENIKSENNYYEKYDYKELKEKYTKILNKIVNALNSTAWDGKWFLRAFDDDQNKVGSFENTECKIDSICQSFSVLSGVSDNDKKIIAMNSLEEYLIDEENKVLKLFTPATDKVNLGYITSYAKGMRENGGQYTHAAIWALIAEAILKRNDKVFEIYKIINPIEHTKNIDEVLKYKVEPYSVEADIYSEGNFAGRGGWTWYTGSSGWLYEAQIRYILGINIYHQNLSVNPCVPNNWKEFSVDFKWKNANYLIKYKKINNSYLKYYECKENDKIIEIKEFEENKIKLRENGNFILEVYF